MGERVVIWHRLVLASRDEDDAELAAAWARSVAARVAAGGGELLGQISSNVVASFDPSEASDALEVALELLDEADDNDNAVAIGAALGAVRGGVGRAVELAQLLCVRARAGDLVVDPALREHLDEYLFERSVGSGVAGLRGVCVDRKHPRRLDAAAGIASLGPPGLAPPTAAFVDDLRALAAAANPPAIVLRGPVGAGATELVREAAGSAPMLTIGASAGGVAPLASLRYALLFACGSAEAVVAHAGAKGEVLDALCRGSFPPRAQLVAALVPFFKSFSEQRRLWLFVTPLSFVDAPTLDAILGARDAGADVVIAARYPLDARLPAGVDEGPGAIELVLPVLRPSDARVVAEGLLGAETANDVIRRVAVMGGDSSLGVTEAARALLASGDVVRAEGGFAWRATPRAGVTASPLEHLVAERFAGLDDPSRRVLETICVAPEGGTLELIQHATARDGLSDAARDRAYARLAREGWLDLRHERPGSEQRPHPSSSFARRLVVQMMPPGRRSELHRYIAESLAQRPEASGEAGRGELGFYLTEGGQEAQGATYLLGAGQAALAAGYRRGASRIAAWLARHEAASRVRVQADALSRAAATIAPPALDEEPGPPSTEIALDQLGGPGDTNDVLRTTSTDSSAVVLPPPPPLPSGAGLDALREGPTAETDLAAIDGEPPDAPVASSLGELPPALAPRSQPGDLSGLLNIPALTAEAEDAVKRGDAEALGRIAERATAAGSDLGAVTRFRAIADLVRGDVDAARRTMERGRSLGAPRPGTAVRDAVVETLVLTAGGEIRSAVRAALRGIALARREGDAKGEDAALRALAGCYRAVGREEDATRIDVATA